MNKIAIEGRRRPIFNVRFLTIFVVALIVISGSLYVVRMNRVLVKNFKIQDLKKQAESISAENRDLELRTIALGSYDRLNEKIQDLRLVPIEEIDYITLKNGIIAKK
mgnify:CR=1 FL=1